MLIVVTNSAQGNQITGIILPSPHMMLDVMQFKVTRI
jgi:hypothetical protein